MRNLLAFAVLSLLWTGCDQAESSRTVEYVADGSARNIDVAFIAPAGIPAETDTLFMRGDSMFVRGDTTFVLNAPRPWKLRFEAEQGQQLYLRTTNRTASGHVSAIVYVDEKFYASDGSGDSLKVATFSSKL